MLPNYYGTLQQKTLIAADPSLGVDPAILSHILYTGGTPTFDITVAPSSLAWEAAERVPYSWISLSDYSGSGDDTITVTVSSNSGVPRIGYIDVSANGVSTKTVSVSQNGVPATLSVSPTTQSWDYEGNNCDGTEIITVTASAGNSWTATPNISWINVSGGSGTGSGSFTVSVTPNFGFEREGTITVSSDAADKTVTIFQTEDGISCP